LWMRQGLQARQTRQTRQTRQARQARQADLFSAWQRPSFSERQASKQEITNALFVIWVCRAIRASAKASAPRPRCATRSKQSAIWARPGQSFSGGRQLSNFFLATAYRQDRPILRTFSKWGDCSDEGPDLHLPLSESHLRIISISPSCAAITASASLRTSGSFPYRSTTRAMSMAP
jgi:hypothetical protein